MASVVIIADSMWFTFALIAIFAVNCEGVEKINSVQSVIFGGSLQNITDAPYFAVFLVSYKPICGASIVNEKVLLTAAHCYFPEHNHSVLVATDQLKQGMIVYGVEKIVLHPKYVSAHPHYDLAVVKIEGRFFFDDEIFPIRLAPRGIDLKLGQMLTTMGFGTTETNEQGLHLLSVSVPYVPKEICEKLLPDITDDIICAGGNKGNDACLGDSGGPLVYNNFLVGIVSFSYGGCGSELPAGYSRISVMRDFIDATVRKLTEEKDHF